MANRKDHLDIDLIPKSNPTMSAQLDNENEVTTIKDYYFLAMFQLTF